MKKFIILSLSALSLTALSLFSTGCATVKVATENGRTLAAGECTSWRLLWWIPLFGGDCDEPNDDFCVWFKNTATLDGSVKLLNYACERKHARGVKDVQTLVQDTHFFFVLRRTAIYTSAELVY